MPLYPYECEACKYTENMFMSMKTDATTLKCPKCGRKRLTRQLSLPNYVIRDNYENVGSASESNIRKMGKYAYSEMIEREKIEKKEIKRKAQQKIAEATGGTPIEVGENPLGLKDVDLSKIRSVEDYIMTGETT